MNEPNFSSTKQESFFPIPTFVMMTSHESQIIQMSPKIAKNAFLNARLNVWFDAIVRVSVDVCKCRGAWVR